MPRKIADDDLMPRRRRGAKAVAIEAEEERGLVMRILLHSPKDMVAGALAVAAVLAIITNALFLQAGRHPSPMFGGSVVTLPQPAPPVAVASPLPRPRPVEVAVRPAEPAPAEPKAVEAKPVEVKNSDPKTSDPMTNLVVKSTSSAPAATSNAANPVVKPTSAAPIAALNVARPPAPIPSHGDITQSTAAHRIAAVQRALTEYGYGQLRPTGTIGSDTQAAISKFERDRKLPVTGQISERVVKELAAMIGHPID
ncbi:peptidoglycan-binding protein [Bradyrhizobium sp. Ash2021]|uniref:peptidoglycan-binding protein n=1 Tax=Bradyrhizobium sp. Ash2021 TaxID=2954771 RepID=UPI00281509AD|nr:peptidoglycan-binding protein [Bradyrhizobium sp. Ash2021]WMT77911.1 peptidoglycan-binding protein [Bradyrhizobium sp. Ash2021]